MKAKLILVACLLLLTAVAIWRIPSRSEKDANASLAANSVNSNSSSPPAGTNFSSGAKVHPRLASIFAKPDERPELSVLAALRPEDEPALLREYQQKTNFYQRIASMWALGFVGGDATVPVFKHALTDEFKGRPLALGMPGKTRDEFEAMIDTVWALAMIAERSDASWELLKQGTDAEYWSKAARWQAQDADNEFRTLAGRCMQGIGISGRKEAPDLLDSIAKAMKQPSVERWPFVRAINGELLEGAFFYAIIREEGRPAFLARFFGGGENDVFVSGGLWGKWSATPEGQKWNAWDDNFRKERGRLLRKANP